MGFLQIVQKNFDEWKNQGYCNDAIMLNKKIGINYFDVCEPHFFTGDLNSEIVLVMLNPKRNKVLWNKPCDFFDWKSYLDSFTHFGLNQYGNNSKRIHKSPFDHKQVRFMKPFNILPFNGEKYHDLEIALDNKLQLELVPFGSPDFDYHVIGINNLEYFINRLLNVLQEYPKKYIIFCGRVFLEVFNNYTNKKIHHKFKLMKTDGNFTKSQFEVINIELFHNNQIINACIAPQFALQGAPIEAYGEKIRELYFDL